MADCIYFRHSFKKAFKTVRVYQVPCEKPDKDEQVERSNLIFTIYNTTLGRNPSTAEFLNWYFYSGHELYKGDKQKNKDYRMSATRNKLCESIIKKPGDVVQKQFKFGNNKEYKWIVSGKLPAEAPNRPTETLSLNPFDQSADEINAEINSNSEYDINLNDFFDSIESSNDANVEPQEIPPTPAPCDPMIKK